MQGVMASTRMPRVKDLFHFTVGALWDLRISQGQDCSSSSSSSSWPAHASSAMHPALLDLPKAQEGREPGCKPSGQLPLDTTCHSSPGSVNRWLKLLSTEERKSYICRPRPQEVSKDLPLSLRMTISVGHSVCTHSSLFNQWLAKWVVQSP